MAAKSARGAVTSVVAMTSTSVTIFADGLGTVYRSVTNTSGQILYLLFNGGTATSTFHTIPIAAGAFYEFPIPVYLGAVTAAIATGTGNIVVTSY